MATVTRAPSQARLFDPMAYLTSCERVYSALPFIPNVQIEPDTKEKTDAPFSAADQTQHHHAEPSATETVTSQATPRIIARYHYPDSHLHSPPPLDPPPSPNSPSLFTRLLHTFSTYLRTALSSHFTILHDTSIVNQHQERTIRVMALTPQTVVQGANPIFLPIEVTAQHKRIREILASEAGNLATEMRYREEIREAFSKLRGG